MSDEEPNHTHRLNPWETKEGKVVWKTKAQYFTWLRGQIRKIWSNYPVRIEWKNSSLRPVTPEEKSSKKFHPSTKNVGQCSLCNEWFAGSKLQCDHITASEGCYDYSTAESFLWHNARTLPSEFQLVCEPCHKIKNHAEKYGFTFDEARIDKEVIALVKTKKLTKWLKGNNIEPASNETKRKQQAFNFLKEKLNESK